MLSIIFLLLIYIFLLILTISCIVILSIIRCSVCPVLPERYVLVVFIHVDCLADTDEAHKAGMPKG